MRFALLLVLVGGCFNPTFHDPSCGPNGECPAGTQCVLGTCRSGNSMDGDVADDGDIITSDGRMIDAAVDAAGPFAGCQNDSDLIACYRFETAAPALQDGSSFGNDGSSSSGVSLVASGRVGGAMQFTGSASGFTVPNDPSLNVTAVTVEAWVFLNVVPTGGARVGVLDKDSMYAMFVYGDQTVRCTIAATVISAPITVAAAQWTHLACSYSGSAGGRIYQDGVLKGTQTPMGAIPNVNSPMGVGMNSPNGDSLNGKLDEVKVWRRVLSATDICNEVSC